MPKNRLALIIANSDFDDPKLCRILLLYYSGHGIRDDHGDLYPTTRDTEMVITSATVLDAVYVCTHIDKSRTQRKVVVLDCGHSGAFAGSKSGLGNSVGTEDTRSPFSIHHSLYR